LLDSSLSPHKKALKIDFIKEMVPVGALKKERKYIEIENKIDLSKINRPLIDRWGLFHRDNLQRI
jgi:hypothetical protein